LTQYPAFFFETTGDAHYDFVVTRVLHQQGALDMAEGSFAAASAQPDHSVTRSDGCGCAVR
jgi:hypothetical protein